MCGVPGEAQPESRWWPCLQPRGLPADQHWRRLRSMLRKLNGMPGSNFDLKDAMYSRILRRMYLCERVAWADLRCTRQPWGAW